MWDFETDPEYQEKLDWADGFVRDEVEPLDHVLRNPYDKTDTVALSIVTPLMKEVQAQGLWACHLEPALGGQGYGQVKLALLNEILGRSKWAPSVFGCQAPDSGNAEIIAHFGTPSQREKYLRPLLDGEISSSYAMTEVHAGADPTLFRTRAELDGDEWVINGEKWFASNARHASFFVVMAVSNPDVSAYKGMSMYLVPAETPGIEIVRNVGTGTERPGGGGHGYLRFVDVRVSTDNLLGDEGGAFAIAQTRLGGGRVHHAMRTIAMLRKAFDMMCERALSRDVRGGNLASMQMTQEKIADSWIEIEQFRLLVLRTAWLIDKHKDYKRVPQGHRGGEGGDAEGAARRRAAGDAPPRLDRRVERDAVPVDDDGGRGPRHRRRPDRGAPADHRPADPEAVPAGRGALAERAPPDQAGRGPRPLRRRARRHGGARRRERLTRLVPLSAAAPPGRSGHG